MNLLSALRNFWQSLAPRRANDIEEELRSHQQAYQEDLMRQGLTAEEAQRKARIDLGQPEVQNESYRDAIGLRLFDELGGDIRYGLRALRRNPGFAAVAVLSLALGIGATTAMFSLIYAALLHPFPYAGADRIVNPVLINEQRPDEPTWFATMKPQFDTLSHAKSIESLLGFAESNMEITGGDVPENVLGTYLTGNAGTFFGVRALLGRGIEPFDDQGLGQHVTILNYKFWQRHYAGDPHIVGRTIELDHVPYTIVGVMPRRFAFNDTTGTGDLYLPRGLLQDSVNPPVTSPYIPWIKLKPHVSPAAADAELNALVRQFAKENPAHFPQKWHLQLQPIAAPFQQNIGRTLLLLLAGVLLLLIIGCANCSILLLARGRARQHELSVRSAIGASRWRIIRQLLVEALVISFTGAALGVAASYWLARLPMQLSPDSFPQESVIRINLPILAFSVALALLCGILFGLVPALRLSRHDPARTLPGRQIGLIAAPAKHRWSVLIAAQVALTLLLMATAGTAIRSFLHLTQLPLGYDPNHVMQVGIMLPFRNAQRWDSVKSREARTAYIEEIQRKIAAVPGVRDVSIGVNVAPPYTGAEESAVDISGIPHGENQSVRVHSVSPDYFATLRIPLLRGRTWNPPENTRGDFVAIVNQSFVRRYWPKTNPLAGQLRIPGMHVVGPLDAISSQSNAWRQVLGVVGGCAQRRHRSPCRSRHLHSLHHAHAPLRPIPRSHPGRAPHLPALDPRRHCLRGLRSAGRQRHLHPQRSHPARFPVQPPAPVLHIVRRLLRHGARPRPRRHLQRRRLQRRAAHNGVRRPSRARRTTHAYPVGRRTHRPHQHHHRRGTRPRPRCIFRKASRPLDAQRLRRGQSARRRGAACSQRAPRMYLAVPPRHLCPTSRSSPLRITRQNRTLER